MADGSVLMGDFKDNKIEGKGTLVYGDGKQYTGSWMDNKMHG